ncbi:MAG: TolC family protein, partial [Planctomycetes bacterium]|nr:TolC family protein [Planctomycetota bacterium]
IEGLVIPVAGDKPARLSLDDCLRIALRNSRDFQTRKEELFSAALALANTRRGWDFPLLGGSLAGTAGRTVVNRGGETDYGTFSPDASLTQRFIQGGALTLGASAELASDLLGWRSTTIGSLLSANFTQPLLRGAWRGLAYEEQYRAERNFLFTVLEYERYTQEFAVDILTRYYSVLRQRDQLENERSNIKRLEQTFALTKTLVQGGIRSPIEQDQAEQNLISAKVRFQRDQQNYRDALDRFKLTLGLPVAARIEPDYPQALTELNRIGPKPIPLEESQAATVALATRPDALRQAAALRDAKRNVDIAADAFLPQLDVTLGITAPGTEPRDFQRIQFHRHTREVSATFNYELDQTDNRDAYRNAVIAWQKARRDYAQFVDQLRLDVRESYRSLLQSRKSYELVLRNVEIAKRRRKLAVLQQKEGQASARDVLEAEDALRRAQNGVTAALIDYTTTRLKFMTTLGLVSVDEKGNIHERGEPFRFDRLGRRYPYLTGR